jgi:hypothetical protein
LITKGAELALNLLHRLASTSALCCMQLWFSLLLQKSLITTADTPAAQPLGAR